MKQLPHVSFIIPTLNAAEILERCLYAIRSQEYPQKLVEIIISDGGSRDKTKTIAKKYNAIIINNPEVLHEPGKTKGASIATGELLFFTDADNILSCRDWISKMVKPYVEERDVKGFLPQTIPAPDSNILDRYLGYLFTDPFTWFVYANLANPQDFSSVITPLKQTPEYELYKFIPPHYPLFGLSQGVGISRSFDRGGMGFADDMLAGIKLINEGGRIAYIPTAGVYHYHVNGFKNFISKYSWRVRNNLVQKVKGMGVRHRVPYMDSSKKMRMALFIPYALSIIFPIIDGIGLSIKHKSVVMLIHPLVCLCMAGIIIKEVIFNVANINKEVGVYK